MLVETLNKCTYFVSIDHINARNSKIINLDTDLYIYIKDISESLLVDFSKDYNIMNVYIPVNKVLALSIKDCKLIWERKEKVKEYTMNELIKKVGHEFKIKK